MAKPAEITDRRAAFVREYLVDMNATQAAIRAGYSKKTARAQGSRLLTDADIQSAIQRAQQKRSEKTGITAERVLERLAEIGFTTEGDPSNVQVRALELVGKHLGMFADKLEVKDTTLTPEERRARLMAVLRGAKERAG